MLPDAFGQALGAILAEQRKEWSRERERIEADAKALLAETRAEHTTLVAELRAENALLRGQVAERLAQVRDGKDGEQGLPGRDADDDAIVERVLARMPKPQPGAPGRDADEDAIVERVVARVPPGEKGDPGASGDPETLLPIIERMIDDAVAAKPMPEPVPGPKGDPGEKGETGADGKDAAVDYQLLLDELLPFAKTEVQEQLTKAIAALPPPEKGEKGDPGEPGQQGAPGEPGRDGKDGADIVDGFKAHDGRAILTLSNGKVIDLGVVQGKDGAPGRDGEPGKDGRDGADGITLDDVEWHLDHDGERSAILRVVSKGKSVEWTLRLPAIIDRGVWKADVAYERGDAVSHGGNCWIAQKDTSEKPGGNGDWRLAVRHGRDGRDGKDGAKGDKGDPGRPGRDLTLG